MAFSNTPGPIKPFLYTNVDGSKIKTIQSTTYVMGQGIIGLTLSCMTFSNSFRIAVTGDDVALNNDEVIELAELVYKNIVE